jgi:hypothetical protein
MPFNNLSVKTIIKSSTVIKLTTTNQEITILTRKRKTAPTEKHQIIDLTKKVKIQKVSSDSQVCLLSKVSSILTTTQFFDHNDDNKAEQVANTLVELVSTSAYAQTPPCGVLKYVTELGSGTYGKVDKVEDRIGNFYARKVVSTEKGQNFDYPSSMRELSALATFQGHPNIIRVFDTFVDLERKQYTIVSELLDGDLKYFWQRETPKYRMTHFKSMAYQILSALAFLHSLGFVHRDIKSQNILYRKIDGSIQVKVSLFF